MTMGKSHKSIDKVRQYKRAFEEKYLSPPSSDTAPTWNPLPNLEVILEMDKVFERIISGEAFMTQLLKGMSDVTVQNYSSQEVDEDEHNILLTDIVTPEDPRCVSPAFETAKHDEVVGLKARGTWKMVKRN